MLFLAFRFLFILLGPFGRAPQYHEIGRSMATLMTDEVMRRVSCPHLHFGLQFCFSFLFPPLNVNQALCINSQAVHPNPGVSWRDRTFLGVKCGTKLRWQASGDESALMSFLFVLLNLGCCPSLSITQRWQVQTFIRCYPAKSWFSSFVFKKRGWARIDKITGLKPIRGTDLERLMDVVDKNTKFERGRCWWLAVVTPEINSVIGITT